MKKLKFALDNITEISEELNSKYEKMKKSRFAEVKMRLFGDGENAHTEPVDLETIKASADSAYDIPLIAELNPYRMNNDFGGHGILTGKEFSFGFIKESKDNPIEFETDENGKTFLTLRGLIWKKYFSNIIDILTNRDNKVEVSVELEELSDDVSENGKPILHRFVLNAVTFLGEITTSACKGAVAELCFSEEVNAEFLKDKNNYMKHFDTAIKIDNSKEKAVDGKWSNPRQKLLNPILKASNKIALLNEAYLFYDKTDEDITLSDVSYPHHIIKNGELLLHIRGVQSAFSRLAQQGKVTGEAKKHLLRHYKTLGLNTENFEEFGLTKEQFDLYFSEDLRKEEEVQMAEEIKESQEEVLSEEEEKEEIKCEETVEHQEETTEVKESEEIVEAVETETEAEATMSEESTEEVVEAEETVCEGCLALEKEKNDLIKENEELKAKLELMADYEELKSFKETTLIKEAELKETEEMNKVLFDLEGKGVKMGAEVKDELIAKRKDFSNTTAWSNYVKAYAFDNLETVIEDGIVKTEIYVKSAQNERLGSWQSLADKYN